MSRSPRRRCESARQGRRAVRAGPGDALGRRVESRRADPRHRSGARGHGRRHRHPHARGLARQSLKPGEFGIVLGAELARALGVRHGDTVVVITPQGTMTPAGTLPRLKSFRVVGVFEVGMYEFDSGLALIDIDDAKKLYRLDGVSGVRLKLDDLFVAPAVARELAGIAARRRRDPRLDAEPRQFLPRRADREARDVHHPDADHRGRRVQHRVGAGDDRHRQAGRHRDPAHAGRVAARRSPRSS